MALSSFLMSSSRISLLRKTFPVPTLFFSSSSTPYPLQYELIASRPASFPLSASHPRKPHDENPISDTELPVSTHASEMDKSKRKYYRKRRKRMYGSDEEDDGHREDKYIELKPEVVDLPTLHAREEELFFYDTFAFPWEKEKHYRMVYQLEKKYFPDQCLDKAFIQEPIVAKKSSRSEDEKNKKKKKEGKIEGGVADEGLMFFEEEKDVREKDSSRNIDVSEKKVEELFKCLKKVPSVGEVSTREPFIATRKTGLPPRWDGPFGTVVMVKKPKGQFSLSPFGNVILGVGS